MLIDFFLSNFFSGFLQQVRMYLSVEKLRRLITNTWLALKGSPFWWFSLLVTKIQNLYLYWLMCEGPPSFARTKATSAMHGLLPQGAHIGFCSLNPDFLPPTSPPRTLLLWTFHTDLHNYQDHLLSHNLSRILCGKICEISPGSPLEDRVNSAECSS